MSSTQLLLDTCKEIFHQIAFMFPRVKALTWSTLSLAGISLQSISIYPLQLCSGARRTICALEIGVSNQGVPEMWVPNTQGQPSLNDLLLSSPWKGHTLGVYGWLGRYRGLSFCQRILINDQWALSGISHPHSLPYCIDSWHSDLPYQDPV